VVVEKRSLFLPKIHRNEAERIREEGKKEIKGKERKGKERKGKERKEKKRKEKKRKEKKRKRYEEKHEKIQYGGLLSQSPIPGTLCCHHSGLPTSR
jgi:hypothetical protein